MKIFDSTLIYPIFDVESIGDGPRVPRAHLACIVATTSHMHCLSPVRSSTPPVYDTPLYFLVYCARAPAAPAAGGNGGFATY